MFGENVGSPNMLVMLGRQNCWECKNVGRTKMLGGQNCWEYKNVGSPKLLGVLKCWEVKNVIRMSSRCLPCYIVPKWM